MGEKPSQGTGVSAGPGSVRMVSERGIVYERRGEGRPVVFLHGWCLNRALWTYAEEALVDSHEVITPDLPGFGASAGLAPPYRIDRYAEEVSLLLGELGLSEATVVGFAFGAAVGMRAAATAPASLAALVAIGAPSAAHSPYERMPRAMRRDWPDFARRSAEAICSRPQSEATIDWLARMFEATPLRTALATVAEMADFEPVDTAPAIRVPTLYLHGAEDPVVPVSISEACADASPSGELAVVADCGHLVPIDQPEAFHGLLADFLQKTN
jgi:pimeloyl-ACP methyl ester carboxylesterase